MQRHKHKFKELEVMVEQVKAEEASSHERFRQINWRKMPPKGEVMLLLSKQRNLDQGVKNLRQQLNEFIEERQGWLQEIDRRQAELVAAQIAIEKHRRQEQLLGTENETLKMELQIIKRK